MPFVIGAARTMFAGGTNGGGGGGGGGGASSLTSYSFSVLAGVLAVLQPTSEKRETEAIIPIRNAATLSCFFSIRSPPEACCSERLSAVCARAWARLRQLRGSLVRESEVISRVRS